MELDYSLFGEAAQNALHLVLVPAEFPPAGFSLEKKKLDISIQLRALHTGQFLCWGVGKDLQPQTTLLSAN